VNACDAKKVLFIRLEGISMDEQVDDIILSKEKSIKEL